MSSTLDGYWVQVSLALLHCTAAPDDRSSTLEGPQELILENLRAHKEVLGGVKLQPWGMRRKLRLVRQAKTYVKRHEGQLHARSHATRDIAARFNLWMLKRWQRARREGANLLNALLPWERRIKEIESHFGSVVASYFTFLRWLCWVNLVIVVVITAFVAVPEILIADAGNERGDERKKMLPEEEMNATNFYTLWDFEGPLRYSPLFYGYYTHREDSNRWYRLPFAYFMTGLAVYVYSFVATLRKMASNSRMSKLSEKDDECVFTWKLFAGWDYMIGNAETAHNRVASTVLGFKEALLEEAEKQREERDWKIMIFRFLVNILVLGMLASSAYAVVLVVKRSTEKDAESTLWRRNETTVVVNIVNFVFPVLFEVLGILERYHPRKTLRVQLARIMALNLINIYTLIFSMFQKINEMSIEMQTIMGNASTEENVICPGGVGRTANFRSSVNSKTAQRALFSTLNQTLRLTTTPPTGLPPESCFEASVSCGTKSTAVMMFTLAMTSGLPRHTTEPLPLTTASHVNAFLTNHLQTTTLVTPPALSSGTSPVSWPSSSSPSPWTSSTGNGNDSALEANGTEFSTPNVAYEESLREHDNNLGMLQPDSLRSYLEDPEYRYHSTGRDDVLDEFPEGHTLTSQDTTPSLWMTTPDGASTASSVVTEENIPSTTSEYNRESTLTETTLRDLVSRTEDQWSWKNTAPDKWVPIDASSSPSTGTSPATGTSSTTMPASTTCYIAKCVVSPKVNPSTSTTAKVESSTTPKTKRRLRRLCWETMFGQELVKMTVMDLVMTIGSTLLIDFFRAIFVRVMNNCWCWDLEKKFPQYGDFKIAENILHLVNNQGMVWMGMFFSPGLPLINLVKLAIMMYLRSWAVLTCNVPHEVVFRASRSNNFYLALLLTMLFLCVLPVGYAIVRLKPSWHCGPFSCYTHTSDIFVKSLYDLINDEYIHEALDYMASPGIVIPLLLLLSLVIYYLVSLTNSLREANNDLKLQLRRERTEERRKMFQLVGGSGSGGDLTEKWRKLTAALPSLPISASANADSKAQGEVTSETKPETSRRKDLLNRLIKRALRKSSATSDEESVAPSPGPGQDAAQDGAGTDAEQPDCLPDDGEEPGRSYAAALQEREDSLQSAWSDVIPEIRISKTESSECMLEQAEQPQTAQPQCPSKAGSSDTIVAAEDLAHRKRASCDGGRP